MPRFDNKLGTCKIIDGNDDPDYFVYKGMNFLPGEFTRKEFDSGYKYLLKLNYSMYYAINVVNNGEDVELHFLIF